MVEVANNYVKAKSRTRVESYKFKRVQHSERTEAISIYFHGIFKKMKFTILNINL